MEPIDSKPDLFQSLKDEDLIEQGTEQQNSFLELGELKFGKKTESNVDEVRSDDDLNDEQADDFQEGGSSLDQGVKRKLDKQNRKEVEEEEREKML